MDATKNRPPHWQYFDALCPSCHHGFLRQKAGSVYYSCSVCSKNLECPNCQATRSLDVVDEGTKVASCRACHTTWWWDERRTKNVDCSYCGNDGSECPYCRPKPKKKRRRKPKPKPLAQGGYKCPKCTSRNVIKQRTTASCLSCQVEFPLHMLEPSNSEPDRIITDPNEIRKLAKDIFTRCPSCNWGQSKDLGGGKRRCLACGMPWQSSPLDYIEVPETKKVVDAFWQQKCISCDAEDQIIRHPSGQLECFGCGSRWTPKGVMKKGQLIELDPTPPKAKNGARPLPVCDTPPPCDLCSDGGHVKLCPTDFTWMCLYCKRVVGMRLKSGSKNACPLCNDGFFNDGKCDRCGARLWICEKCGKPYKDRTQRSGACEECRDNPPPADDLDIICPVCATPKSLDQADIRTRCDVCKEWHSVELPISLRAASLKGEGLNQAIRYFERKGQLTHLVDEAIDAVRETQDSLNYADGKAEDEFVRLEDYLQKIVDVQQFIETGFDENAEEDDIWEEYEEEDRWSGFDREQRRLGAETYCEVEIEDAGDDLLDGHDALTEPYDDIEELLIGEKVNKVCTHCGWDIDDYGMCTNCEHSYDLFPS